jgi:bifunctional non-homologous end joining protein LigD
MPMAKRPAKKNPLADYKAKRTFTKTPEPAGRPERSKDGRLYVIQKHRASHLHYDLRLEERGTLRSWAVPKGPSTDPSVKRLAMAVEDHPISYADFEGVIPEGQYGAGTVMVWDQGTYVPEGNDGPEAGLEKGDFKFTLNGRKLKGSWVLVRTRNRHWLLIKHRDRHASANDITETAPRSVVTGRSLAEIARAEGGNVEKAATGDPSKIRHLKKSS